MSDKKILGVHWQFALGVVLIYVGILGAVIQGFNWLNGAVPSVTIPDYEYRLVTPAEAMRLVNDEGWRVSERIKMTDQAVYVYHRK